MPDPRLLNPEHDAEMSRAFTYAIQMGWLLPSQIDQAKQAGRTELRQERIRDRVNETEAA